MVGGIKEVETAKDVELRGIDIPAIELRAGVLIIPKLASLHLGLDVLKEGLELVHIGRLLGPTHAETLGLIWLGNLQRVSVREFEAVVRSVTMWK